jgi:hypothetical protein
MDDESVKFKGFRYRNLYLVDFSYEYANLRICLFTKASLGWLWHRRLAHVGMSTLKKILKKDMVIGLKYVVFEKDKLCSACQACRCFVPTVHYGVTHAVLLGGHDIDRWSMVRADARWNTENLYMFWQRE